MKKTQLLYFILFLVLCSCNEINSFNQFYDNFENNRWEQADKKEFDFSIKDDSAPYDLILRFSHVYDYQFESVPLVIEILNPDGTVEKMAINLKIKDDSGKQLAECSGDVCDLNFKIKEQLQLKKGNYKITISNTFNGPYLPNVLGVGLKLKILK